MFPISRSVSESAARTCCNRFAGVMASSVPAAAFDLKVRNGSYRVYQRYLCKNFGRTFNDKTDTIFAHSKSSLIE